MSAEPLRQAAALMRWRAEAATPGRWGVFGMTVLASTDGTSNADTATEVAQGLTVDENTGSPRTWDVDHIASWHPTVALAVADWLDMTAQHKDSSGGHCSCDDAALAVATAYLGAPP